MVKHNQLSQHRNNSNKKADIHVFFLQLLWCFSKNNILKKVLPSIVPMGLYHIYGPTAQKVFSFGWFGCFACWKWHVGFCVHLHLKMARVTIKWNLYTMYYWRKEERTYFFNSTFEIISQYCYYYYDEHRYSGIWYTFEFAALL